MRRAKNVQSNVASSDAGPLPAGLLSRLKDHRWVRTPTDWSQ
jgi:hypothetical protein